MARKNSFNTAEEMILKIMGNENKSNTIIGLGKQGFTSLI